MKHRIGRGNWFGRSSTGLATAWLLAVVGCSGEHGGGGNSTSVGGNPNVGGASSAAGEAGNAGHYDAGAAGTAPVATHVCSKAALDATTTTSFYEAAQCLYVGANAPQRNVVAGSITAERVAILRGKVLDASQNPLAGVRVTVQGHAEFGETITDPLGEYALAVNGGGGLILSFTKTGLLPLQRQRRADWLRFTVYPAVTMLTEATTATAVDLATATLPILAVGAEVKDDSGARSQAVLVRPATKVTLELPNGEKQTLSEFHLRSTEYTVGAAGPQAMPGDLPSNSGYTYATEFSLDEARAVGAKQVHFDPPVISYVDNFLRFPAGTSVPAGYYDSDLSVWVPGDSGIVIAVTAVTSGVASIDATGDGVADDQATLTALGIDSTELAVLGAKYEAGASLWRVPLSHFSPWDFNWGFGPPADAAIPNPGVEGGNIDDCQTTSAGSIIGCESQTLGESVPIAGTPLVLHYQSERMPGRRDSHALNIQLSGPTLPASVKSILLEVEVLGKVTQKSYAPAPNLTDSFEWDGTDVWGRTWQGRQVATVSVGYVYDGAYQRTNRFGSPPSSAVITGSRTRQEVTLWRKWEGYVGGLNAGVMGLGGWTVDVQHLYDPRSRVLYFGDGRNRSADSVGSSVSTIVGTGTKGYSGDNGPALSAQISQPHGIVVAPNGSVYLADDHDHVIRRVGADGIITTIAGTGTAGYSGDGGRASAASFSAPMGLALGPDGTLYIADADNHRVRAIGPDGNIRTVAGGGTKKPTATKPVAAAEATMTHPHSLSLLSDGTLYVADDLDSCIYSISPDAMVSIVAGGGSSAMEGANATETKISTPVGIAVSTSGELYYTEWDGNRVRRVDTSGRVWTIAGTGTSGFSGDGGPGSLAKLYQPHTVEVGPDGSVFITDEGNRRLRRVSPDGYIETIAGTGSSSSATTLGDNGPPLLATFTQPRIVYHHEDGSLWIADYADGRIRRLRPSLPGYASGETVLAATDARELYVFDSLGRHLRTVDAVTRVVLWKFGYDAAHRLIAITDRDGNQTTITRNSEGVATSLVGPYGAQTSLSMLSSGYLGTLTDPLARKTTFTYGSGGLLETLTEPDNGQSGVHRFTYDGVGRLLKDEGPGGYAQTLARKVIATGTEVTLTSPLGRSRLHRLEEGSNGQTARTVIAPDGAQSVTLTSPGKASVTNATGTVKQTLVGDPRFGLQAPIAATVDVTSGTLPTMAVARSRTVTQTDSTDPTSLAHLTEKLTVNGRVTTIDYDTTARSMVVTSPVGRKATSTWDTLGRVVSTQYGNLTPSNVTYDSHGRIATLTVGERVSQFAYGSNGHLASVTDALGRTTALATDAAGRQTAATLPDLATLSFAYDAHDNNQTITTASNATHGFTFGAGDLLSSYMPPAVENASATTAFAHNGDRQLSEITLPDTTKLVLGYDATSGKLISTTLPGTEGQIALAYDATTGQLVSQAFAGETVTVGYNGDVLSSVTYAGSIAGSVSFGYDKNHWLTSEQIGTATATSYTYDNDGLLTKAGSETVTRDASHGAVTATTLGNTSESFTYSGYGELASYVAKNGSPTLLSQTFTRDAAGRISQLVEQIGSENHTYQYSYHPRGWLTTVQRDTVAVETYGYDVAGNRTSSSSASGTLTATYDAMDRVTGFGGNGYAYSASGNLASKQNGAGTTSYRYNALGALAGVTLGNGTTIDYQLDATGRRLSKSVNGVVTRGWIYRDALRPAAELDATGKVTSIFVYGTRATTPDYLIRGTRNYKIIADWRGSVRLVVDASTGEVAQRIDYDSFGNVTSDSSPGFQPFGFGGGLYDSDTKLVRFGARDYDAETGRWTNRDPILFKGGQSNLYVYVQNDPVDWQDETGLAGPQGAIIGGIVGAVASGVGSYLTGANAGQIAMATALGGGIGALGGLMEPGVGTSAGIGGASGVVGALATGGGYGSMALSGLAGAASGAVGALAPGTSGIVVGALTGFAGGMAAAGPGVAIDSWLNRNTARPCPSSR